MPVAVVTDSTHYLPADVLARHELYVVSLYVKRGDTLERESEISDLDAFYDRLRTGSDVPTTSLSFPTWCWPSSASGATTRQS